jgi:exopolysaccharide production protein ExoZ
MLALEDAGAVPRSRLFSYVGDGSYSIYLWHTFAISTVVKFAGFLDLPAALIVTVAVVAGTLAGLLFYEMLEKNMAARLRALLRRCGPRRSRGLEPFMVRWNRSGRTLPSNHE